MAFRWKPNTRGGLPHSDRLVRLATEHGAQKNPAKLVAYEQEFSRLSECEMTILEIGVKGGGSLKTWEAFFPRARIVGVDIHAKPHDYSDRVTLVQGDQGDPAFIQKLIDDFAPFGVVIDDGSHEVDHQILGFEMMFPHVLDGGLYVLEDIHSGYRDDYNPNKSQNAVDYVRDMVPYQALHHTQMGREDFNYSEYLQHSATKRERAINIGKIVFSERTVIIEKRTEASQVKQVKPPKEKSRKHAAAQEG